MNSAAPTVSTPNVALIIGITGQDGSYLAELLLEKAMWSIQFVDGAGQIDGGAGMSAPANRA